MLKNLKIIFQEIGLGEDEAEVYLVCLKLGPCTVLQIAKKTNIIRATLYKILSRLESKGLVAQIERDERSYHVAETPDTIIEILKQERDAKEKAIANTKFIIEDLKKTYHEKDIPEVHFYEGQKALAELVMLPTHTTTVKEINALIDFDTVFSFLPEEELRRFMERRLEKNIKLRILRKIVRNTFKEYSENDSQELREKRILPENFNLNAGFLIFGDKVAIITVPGDPFGILINSKHFADTMKSIFENLWVNSKKTPD